MQETNGKTTSPLPLNEICTMRIAFPIKTDEDAIEVKKRIAEILKDVEDVRIQFSITTSPLMPNMPLR